MAKRPFQSSASELQKLVDLLSTLCPWSSGTSDATDSSAVVVRNQPSPAPLPACDRSPPPRAASTDSAATKPTMASRPLIRSGAGPLNASASHTDGLAFTLGLGAAGLGLGVDGLGVGDEVDALVVSLVGSISGSVWALTTRARRRRGASAERLAERPTAAALAKELKAIMVAITRSSES